MKTFALLLPLLFISLITNAFGGSANSASPTTERAWHYENQRLATFGSFIKTENGKVLIQTKDEVVSLSIASLYWGDKEYIRKNTPQRIVVPSSSTTNFSSAWIYSAFLLCIVGISIQWYVKR